MRTKQLTIRGVSSELGRRLEKLGQARKKSVNATVLEILERAVGLEARREWLRTFATWTKEDAAEFDRALKAQRKIDEALWR